MFSSVTPTNCPRTLSTLKTAERFTAKLEKLEDKSFPWTSHLVELPELAELIPQIAFLTRASEITHPHLRSRYVSHLYSAAFGGCRRDSQVFGGIWGRPVRYVQESIQFIRGRTPQI